MFILVNCEFHHSGSNRLQMVNIDDFFFLINFMCYLTKIATKTSHWFLSHNVTGSVHSALKSPLTGMTIGKLVPYRPND